MAKEHVRSTIFRHGVRPSQEEQERVVGEIFAKSYEQETGTRLEGNVRGPNPPDRLFYYQDLKIGVEMFELDQRYEPRALFNDLENEIYSELEACGANRRYDGVGINFGILADTKVADQIKTVWQQKGIKRNPIQVSAKEFVDWLKTNVPSRENIPDGGLLITVDPGRYPALSSVRKSIQVRRCHSNDTRRTDGKASPLVTMCPGYTVYGPEIVECIKKVLENKIEKKMKSKHKWESVDHSVLVAHDIPRGEVYESFAVKWTKWVAQAVSEVDVLKAFDELWLVTIQDLRGKAQRICGIGLNRRLGKA